MDNSLARDPAAPDRYDAERNGRGHRLDWGAAVKQNLPLSMPNEEA
jgi:hypothetical protein